MKIILIIGFLIFGLPFICLMLLMARPHIKIKRRFKDCEDGEAVGKQILKEMVSLIENTLQTKLPEYKVVYNYVPMIDFCESTIYGDLLLVFKDKPSEEFIKLLEKCNTKENKDNTKYDFLYSSINFFVYKDAVTVQMHFSESEDNYRFKKDKPYGISYKDFNYHREAVPPQQPPFINSENWNEILKNQGLPQAERQ